MQKQRVVVVGRRRGGGGGNKSSVATVVPISTTKGNETSDSNEGMHHSL